MKKSRLLILAAVCLLALPGLAGACDGLFGRAADRRAERRSESVLGLGLVRARGGYDDCQAVQQTRTTTTVTKTTQTRTSSTRASPQATVYAVPVPVQVVPVPMVKVAPVPKAHGQKCCEQCKCCQP